MQETQTIIEEVALGKLPEDTKQAIAILTKAERFLNDADSLEDVIKVHDFATASAAVLRVRKSELAEAYAVKIKLKAERKAGEKIPNEILKGANNKSKLRSQRATLTQLGITKSESSRWQKISRIPEKRFNDNVEKITKASQKAVLEVSKEYDREIALQNLKAIPIPEKLDIQIYNCDFTKLAIENNSVDFTFTDPPWTSGLYDREWDNLGVFCSKVLKPGSRLFVYCGHKTLLHYAKILEKNLEYLHPCAIVLTANRNAMQDYFCEWRPALVFQKPPYKKKAYCTDLFDNDAPEKKYHNWGQGVSAAEQIVRFHTKPGDTILEPFAGGGSFIEACIRQGRNCIAAEIDKKAYALLKKRFPEACKD